MSGVIEDWKILIPASAFDQYILFEVYEGNVASCGHVLEMGQGVGEYKSLWRELSKFFLNIISLISGSFFKPSSIVETILMNSLYSYIKIPSLAHTLNGPFGHDFVTSCTDHLENIGSLLQII